MEGRAGRSEETGSRGGSAGGEETLGLGRRCQEGCKWQRRGQLQRQIRAEVVMPCHTHILRGGLLRNGEWDQNQTKNFLNVTLMNVGVIFTWFWTINFVRELTSHPCPRTSCQLKRSIMYRDRPKFGEFYYCRSLSLLPSLPAAFTQPGAPTLANLCSMLPRLHQSSSLEFRTVIRTDLLKIIESLSHLRLSKLSNFRSVQPAVLYGNKL